MWKTLRHPNVLPLVGVMISKNQFAMVSDWMMNENIGDFVRAHPDVNRIKLVGFRSWNLSIFTSLIMTKLSSWRVLRRG